MPLPPLFQALGMGGSGFVTLDVAVAVHGYLRTAVALEAELASVTGIGAVYLEERDIRNEQMLQHYLARPQEEGIRDRMEAWFIIREEIAEEWWSSERTMAIERYTLAGLRGWEDREGSERRWQDSVNNIWDKFRGLDTLGDALVIEAADTPNIGHAMIGGKLCHVAEIAIEVTELYTITTPAVTAPVHRSSDASTRQTYADVADQIALYLSTVDPLSKVWAERRNPSDRAGTMDLYAVDLEDTDDRREIRAWQVFRESDKETRGIGQRVVGVSTWKLQGIRSWVDDRQTGEAFQNHIDDVRTRFRSFGYLGSTQNLTLTISSPLQVREIGSRKIQGILCHWADCEIEIEETMHVDIG